MRSSYEVLTALVEDEGRQPNPNVAITKYIIDGCYIEGIITKDEWKKLTRMIQKGG